MEKQNKIAKLAYELYVSSDFKEGRDLDNWLEAEKIFAAKENLEDEIKHESKQKEIVQVQKEPKFEERPLVL